MKKIQILMQDYDNMIRKCGFVEISHALNDEYTDVDYLVIDPRNNKLKMICEKRLCCKDGYCTYIGYMIFND